MSRQALLRTRLRFAHIDTLLSATIVAVVVAACFQLLAAWAVKARLTAVFIELTTQRLDIDEAYAIAGEFGVPGGTQPVRTQGSALISFDVVPRGAGLLAEGKVGHDEQAFAISFLPAVSADGEARLLWLCGQRRAPAGWRAASAPATLVLPHGASYSICRDVGAEGA
jgi:hypothetical protein